MPRRLLRLALGISEYDYEIIYINGRNNINADVMSRPPIVPVGEGELPDDSTEDSEDEREAEAQKHMLRCVQLRRQNFNRELKQWETNRRWKQQVKAKLAAQSSNH